MKIVRFVLLALILSIICFSAVSAITVDELLLEGEVFLIDSGTLYVDVEETVYERDLFTTTLMFLQTSETVVNGNMTLERNGVYVEAEFLADDLENNDTYLLVTWTDSIIENSDYILKFLIDNEEVMRKEFSVATIPKLVENRNYETITITEGQVDGDDELRILLADVDFEYSEEEFISAQIAAEENIIIEKTIEKETITFSDNSTAIFSTIYVTLSPQVSLETLSIIETIPKDIASSTKYITFEKEPIVLEDDPIVMWHFENIDKEQEISYKVEGDLDVTGHTVLLAKTTEQVEKSSGKGFWAFILIPIVAIIIIYFSKFSPKKKK